MAYVMLEAPEQLNVQVRVVDEGVGVVEGESAEDPTRFPATASRFDVVGNDGVEGERHGKTGVVAFACVEVGDLICTSREMTKGARVQRGRGARYC